MEELFSHGFPIEKSLPSAMPCWLSSLAEPWPRQYLRNRSFSGFPSGLIRSNVVKTTTMLCWATIVGSCWITILGKTLVNHLQNNHQQVVWLPFPNGWFSNVLTTSSKQSRTMGPRRIRSDRGRIYLHFFIFFYVCFFFCCFMFFIFSF